MGKLVSVLVTVPLSEAEYRAMFKRRALVGPSTVAGVLREVAGMRAEPYGYTSRKQVDEDSYLKGGEATKTVHTIREVHDKLRELPKEGETWLFVNQKTNTAFTAIIAEPYPEWGTDIPEIAYRDDFDGVEPGSPESGFKFNASYDPIPVKRTKTREETGNG